MEKFIKGYDYAYTISENGVVMKSKLKLKDPKYNINKVEFEYVNDSLAKTGRNRVSLYKDDVRFTINLSYLLAEAFIRNPKKYKYVRNIDGDYTNNSISNLEWCKTRQRLNKPKKETPTCIFCRIVNYFKHKNN